jgi:hypothetical protein
MTRPNTTRPIRVAGANFTEGPVVGAVAAADIVIGQEIDRKRIRFGLPHHRHYFPDEDSHQSISWNPEVFEVEKTGYIRFHRSGRAENWPFPTPGRGGLYAKGRLVESGAKVVVLGTWILNSWNPIHADHHTKMRNKIGRRSLRVLRSRIAWWHLQGYTVIVEGDFNSLRWHGRIGGLRQIKARGLDRAYVSKRGALDLLTGPTKGPKTGVGRDMRHDAVLFTLTTKEKR